MTDFTQSTWVADDYGEYVFAQSRAGTLEEIAKISVQASLPNRLNPAPEETIELRKSVARLIAHAPEMFKLLEYIAVTLAHDTGYSDICSMIHELLRRIDNTPAENKPEAKLKYSSSFFQNRDCEYFPCHAGTDTDTFSCLFCFCPLYHVQECPGNPTYLPSGIKDCSNCTLPHRDYNRVINKLRKERR